MQTRVLLKKRRGTVFFHVPIRSIHDELTLAE